MAKNYKGKRIFLTGPNSFIGRALSTALAKAGAIVVEYYDDVRNYEKLEAMISHNFAYVFHFGSPSSQVVFSRQGENAVDVTVNGFLNLAKICRKKGVKLIYPSTGLLSQGKSNSYARSKAICEDIHKASNLDALGVRIFATYGPGEGHKRDYASVPYLFARDMVQGYAPLIFGDGNQSRDFIYIDDVVDAIMVLAEECNLPVIDLGSGVKVEFNELVREINLILGSEIKPEYANATPVDYPQETEAKIEDLSRFYTPNVSLREGLRNLIDSIK